MLLLKRFLLLLLTILSLNLYAEEANPLSSLAWQFGPGVGQIGDKATIQIPKGYAFLNAQETKKFMEMNQNFANDKEYLFAPESLEWFAVFQFSPEGYIKDDANAEANDIGADKMLEAMKQNTEKANEERQKRGWGTMTILGWRFKPHYDKEAKLLEWAYVAKQDKDNQEVINYNTRILGRTGVMSLVLVSSPETLDKSVATLKQQMAGFDYVAGEKYTEFKEGDRVAEYGLAALIVGGAAAVAAKKGFFPIILGFLAAAWKFIAFAVIGFFAWLKSIFTKKK